MRHFEFDRGAWQKLRRAWSTSGICGDLRLCNGGGWGTERLMVKRLNRGAGTTLECEGSRDRKFRPHRNNFMAMGASTLRKKANAKKNGQFVLGPARLDRPVIQPTKKAKREHRHESFLSSRIAYEQCRLTDRDRGW